MAFTRHSRARGRAALFHDWGTTPVDEAALGAWTKFLRTYKVGNEDPTGHAKVTQAEYDAASNGATLFSIVAGYKKAGIAGFMATHYRGAKPINLEMSVSEISSAQEFNYRMFINLYLTKDQDGDYIRNESMWNVDKEGNYTPKSPNK